jgi:hypothetical protein
MNQSNQLGLPVRARLRIQHTKLSANSLNADISVLRNFGWGVTTRNHGGHGRFSTSQTERLTKQTRNVWRVGLNNPVQDKQCGAFSDMAARINNPRHNNERFIRFAKPENLVRRRVLITTPWQRIEHLAEPVLLVSCRKCQAIFVNMNVTTISEQALRRVVLIANAMTVIDHQ